MKTTTKTMKTTKTLLTIGAVAGLSFTTAQAATLTWDDGAGNDNWTDGVNWVGNPATGPVNGDSVILTTTLQIRLDTDFTIESGQSLTTTATGAGDELTLQTASVLTLATGGTMDIGFMRPRFSNGGDFIIEAGASLDTGFYGLGNTTADLTWIADASSVTTWNNSGTGDGQFNIGSDTLTVDLSSYAVSGESSLTLVDYANAGVLTTTFASETITGTGGWGSFTLGDDPFGDASNLEKGQYFIDYSTGSNITLLLHVPEPSSTALLGLGGLALMLRRKRS